MNTLLLVVVFRLVKMVPWFVQLASWRLVGGVWGRREQSCYGSQLGVGVDESSNHQLGMGNSEVNTKKKVRKEKKRKGKKP